MLKAGKWTLHRAEEIQEVSISGRFQLNSMGLIRKLATLDRGIALLPEEIVAEDVKQGKLKRILDSWAGPPTPVYAMTETRLLPAKTQRFIEFLREKLEGVRR
jgi:DNA-binding transcriptional LysR family regulator